MNAVATEPTYLTQSGIAELYQVSVRTVQRRSQDRDFPRPIRIGRCYRWSRAEVEDFFRKDREEEQV
jgi:predicted DNA-binding transcriptional regulator AlpA